jgi:hypothetical protein
MEERRRGMVNPDGDSLIVKALSWPQDGGAAAADSRGYVRVGGRSRTEEDWGGDRVTALDEGYPEIWEEPGATVLVGRATFGVLEVRGITEVYLCEGDGEILAHARIGRLDVESGDRLQIEWEIRVKEQSKTGD